MGIARGWALWRWHTSFSERLDALIWAAGFLREDPRAPAARALAKRAHLERAARLASRARWWSAPRATVEGYGHLAASTADGRGAIVMFSHVGEYGSLMVAVASRQPGFNVCAAPLRPARGLDDLIRQSRTQWYRENGHRVIHPGGAYPVLGGLLADGETCAIAFDVLGRKDTPLCGGQIGMASGIASLAYEHDVPVVPAFTSAAGGGRHRVLGRLEAPIEPRSFSGVDELHAHLAGVVDAGISENPELAYRAGGAIGRSFERTAYARKLERQLHRARHREDKSLRRAAAAESRRAVAESRRAAARARLDAVEGSRWWTLGAALSRAGSPLRRASIGRAANGDRVPSG